MVIARLAARSTGALGALSAVVALAGCGDDGAAALRSFRFTAPTGAVEIVPVPGEPFAVAWTADADGELQVDVTLAPVNPPGATLALGTAPIEDAALAWTVAAPPPRAGIYQLGATVRAGERVLDRIDAPAIVLVQGAEFRDAALVFTGAQADRDVWITATTGTVIGVEVFLAAAPAAPRLVIARGSIASDLAPIGRVYAFTGTTLDGAPIPAGTYLGFLEITTRDGAVTYLRDGLTLTWTP